MAFTFDGLRNEEVMHSQLNARRCFANLSNYLRSILEHLRARDIGVLCFDLFKVMPKAATYVDEKD